MASDPRLASRPRRWWVCLVLGMAAPPASRALAQAPVPPIGGLDSLLETRISTAAKYGQRMSEVAGSVTIITSDDIERYGYQSLDQVLATVPGFYVSYDRNYSYIGTRGFSRPTDYNNRILLLVDGNVMNEATFGAAPLGSELAIPLRALERVEIIRGPGSALYGTGAIFGVINLITRPPAAIDGGKVDAQWGSYGHRGTGGLIGRRFGNGMGLALGWLWDRNDGQDLYYPEYDAPATNRGVAHGLDWERRWGFLGSITRGDLRLHGRYGARRKAMPTGAYGMAFNAPGAWTWDAYGFLELSYDADLDAARHLTARAYYNHYGYAGDYPFADSLGALTKSTEASVNDALGTELTLRWDLASANRLTAGGEFRRNIESRYYSPRSGPRDMDLSGPSTNVSGYLQDEHQFSRAVSLLAGLRFDASSTTPHSLTPRVALLVRASRAATIKLLYGEAFRAPNVYEAQVGSGSNTSYLRNFDLIPERARTLELVWLQQVRPGVLWSTSLYEYWAHALIDLVVDSGTGLYQYRNVGSATSRGFETGVEARLGSGSAYASYTYQRTIDAAAARRLTNSPAHLLKGGLTQAVTSWLRPGLTLRYESSRRTVYGTATDPYLVADLNLSLFRRPGSATRRLELDVRINNLFNTRYATPGGVEHLQPAIPQDGRNLGAELRYEF